MKKSFFVLIISFGLLLTGCGPTTIEDTTGQKKMKEKQSLSYEETKENIRFKILTNQKEFDLDDEIFIEALASNNGNESINYYAGSSSCVSHLIIQIISKENGNRLFVKSPKEVQGCTDDIHIEQLELKETVQEKVTFLPKESFQYSSEPVLASGGMYDVIVTFLPEDKSRENGISVKTQITIKGTNKEIISKEKAEQIANDNEEVKQWINHHSGDKITKVEDGEYFLLWYDGWQKTTREEFDKLKNGIYQEEKGIKFDDNKWEITYLSKLGPTPNRIKIVINAISERVLSIETFEQ
jgi:hypothetical protein